MAVCKRTFNSAARAIVDQHALYHGWRYPFILQHTNGGRKAERCAYIHGEITISCCEPVRSFVHSGMMPILSYDDLS